MKKIFLVILISLSNLIGSDLNIYEVKKACDLDDSRACSLLGLSYSLGKGVEKNDTLALKYFQKACLLSDGPSCTLSAKCYLLGQGTSKDIGLGYAMLKHSCESLNDREACGILQSAKSHRK